MSKTPIYEIWNGIKKRCDPIKGHKEYAGRDITVCQKWRDSFDAFYADVGDRPSPDHSLDRIDNNGNYEPGNCRWATDFEQASNKRTNRLFSHNGETKHLAEWARCSGISISTLWARIKMGWTFVDAISRPLRRKDRR